MKEYKYIPVFLTAIVIAVTGYSCSNRTGGDKSSPVAVSADTAVIFFREYEHEFGKIAAGEKVACIFTFENKGRGPLVITSVTSSCGCTVPKYDTNPIPPGKTGIVEVVFDSSGRSGRQTKSITVASNASVPIVLLRISGDVITSNNN
jgi:hypothetical protein